MSCSHERISTKHRPPLCHPERSRGLRSTGPSWKCFRGSGLRFEARRADRKPQPSSVRAGASIPQDWASAVGAARFQPTSVLCRKTFPGRACRTADPSTSLGMTKGSATLPCEIRCWWREQQVHSGSARDDNAMLRIRWSVPMERTAVLRDLRPVGSFSSRKCECPTSATLTCPPPT